MMNADKGTLCQEQIRSKFAKPGTSNVFFQLFFFPKKKVLTRSGARYVAHAPAQWPHEMWYGTACVSQTGHAPHALLLLGQAGRAR